MKPEETIDFHLRRLWLKIYRLYNFEAGKSGGTMSVGYILLNIDKEGTPSTKLGPKMGVESRSLTRTLKTMIEKQLIYKTTADNDKRIVLICLTEEGKKNREKARKAVMELNEYLRDHISRKEMELFLDVSEKINRLLDRSEIFAESASTTKPRNIEI